MSLKKSIFLWTLTVAITLSAMVYQRATGPTKPKSVEVELAGQQYKFKLLRTMEIGSPCNIDLQIEDKTVKAFIKYRLYRSKKEWTNEEMQCTKSKERKLFGEGKEIDVLRATLPEQGAAGKIEYKIELQKGESIVSLMPEEPVVVRWKGFVPRGILIPHVIFMILALFFGTRAGVEAIFNGPRILRFTRITLIVLFMGGLVLGPLVQKYAFGDYWTGWPFGGDWTDNKTIISWFLWLIAFVVLRKKPQNKLWPIIALIGLFSIYLIPHSMGGSELNSETGKVETGLKE